MKRSFVFFVLFFVMVSFSLAQTGSWTGELEVMGNKLPLVFHLDDENPSIDSPAQGAKGIPIEVKKSECEKDILISVPVIKASFEGKHENNQIIGTFKQNGMSFPLILFPGEKKTIRPQTPKSPFPYLQEEVSFSNGDALLRGTLNLPQNYNEDTPVLIMITGSGLQNRDEEIFEHKPFAVIADALAKKGIATLRYDDRGFGESTGDAVNCTTEDLMKDALAGIDLLRKRFKNVGVIGHSEGGTIALMLGADKKVDFLISLAGMVVSGKETLMEQNHTVLTEAGFPEEIVNQYTQLLYLILENDDSAYEEIKKSDLTEDMKNNLYAVIQQVRSPYMKYFISLDIRDRLEDISCPVLALNGTRDTQVFYKANLEALNNGLKNNNFKNIKSLDGLNHLFQHCNTGSITEYALIEETIAPEVLDLISGWILSIYS